MKKPEMTQEEITSAEIRIIRWGEKILTPLLIAGFIGIITFLINVASTLGQVLDEQADINTYKSSIDVAFKALDSKIDKQARAQQAASLTIQRIDTSQHNLKEQIQELKSQNAEILRLLRGTHNGANHD